MREALDLFTAYQRQLVALIAKLRNPNVQREVGLSNQLLMDLIFAGLNAAGFSERQKAMIVHACQAVGHGFPISRHAATWPFQTLSLNSRNLSDQDVGMWLHVLDLGMGVMESQNRPTIGITPYLEVIREDDGHILFVPTEQGF